MPSDFAFASYRLADFVRRSKHDGVKRSQLEPIGGGVMGWLDVDSYFEGWAGPDPGDISDDY